MPSRPFEIVVICTGNRFRSPIAEHVLRHATLGLPVNVQSFGVLDLGPVGVLAEALEHGGSFGLDLASHRARRLGTEPLDEADLVLAFERDHVTSAVVTAGAPRERTFTLPELGEILVHVSPHADGDVTERARELVRRAAAVRTELRRGAPPEIRDPLGKSRGVYRETAMRVRELSEEISQRLFRRGSATR
jgi:protein-tyrosine phosphatase